MSDPLSNSDGASLSPDRNVLGQQQQQTMVGPYILGPTLGTGSMGKVKLGTHGETGQKVAIKILRKDMLTRNPLLRRKVEREIAVMKLMDHPNVLLLYDVLQSTRYLYLILEHAPNGEMFHFLRQEGKLDSKRAFHFFRQIINGLEYCHQRLICHRDLKPENLLLDANTNVKIADFGMANMMREGEFMETSCGSPHYASPEVVRGDRYNGMLSDVWSAGVILYALVFGRLPFDDSGGSLQKILLKVKKGDFSFPKDVQVDSEVKDLISMMLRVDPEQRIKVAEIKRHPWWVHQMELLTPEQRAYGKVTTDDFDMELAPVAETEIDLEVMRTIQSLGWNDAALLKSSLGSREENVEKVMYYTLLRRKAGLASAESNDQSGNNAAPSNALPSANDKLSVADAAAAEELRRVTPASPIFDEDEPGKGPSLPPSSTLHSTGHGDSSPKLRPRTMSIVDTEVAPSSSALGAKKKSARLDSGFGLFSDRSLAEVMSELERVLKKLEIQWEKPSEYKIQAWSRVPQKVDFDVEILEVPDAGGYVVNVIKKKGDQSAIVAIFHQLQEELRLMRKSKDTPGHNSDDAKSPLSRRSSSNEHQATKIADD
eukprot:ANDGO_01079.mRNA.1 putative serine/threonine-protein kinase DDB_G0277165